jgi:P27 family predicted phage terminase small subunit
MAPRHLSAAARAEWDRMIALLSPTKMLMGIDADQLALYVTAYARWVEAEKKLAKAGAVIKTKSGNFIPNPWWIVAVSAMKQMHVYLAKFGMNPVDRSKVNVQIIPEDPMASFLEGTG